MPRRVKIKFRTLLYEAAPEPMHEFLQYIESIAVVFVFPNREAARYIGMGENVTIWEGRRGVSELPKAS